MSQRPAHDHDGEPASFDDLVSFGHPRAGVPSPAAPTAQTGPAGDDPRDDLSDGHVPVPVLRQWSDALAAAGLFAEALLVCPAQERADVVRRAELAVLSGDHRTALALLAELDTARTLRTVPASGPGRPDAGAGNGRSGSPWLELLTYCARVLAGETGLLPEVVATSRRVHRSAAVSWVVALAAIAAGDLKQAAPAAVSARAGGCRDLRIIAVSAADRAAEGDEWAAIELIRGAQRIALPDEDPAGLAVELLDRAGLRNVAQRLSARAATDSSLPASSRAAWQAASRRVGAGHKQMWRRSMTAVAGIATRRQEQAQRRRLEESPADLTCRCYGSTGWIGESRLPYVSRHLSPVLADPVAGLEARLVRCRATRLTFLDLPAHQLTLPVVSEATTDVRELPADPFADPDADPEARPTPGMGVSLGMALPA